MAAHRALVVTVPTAALPSVSGATLRVGDVVAALAAAGHDTDVVQQVPATGRWCTGVAVSYASAGHVRALRARAPRVWLDAMDSWLLVDGSGLRAGHPSYALRAARDGARLLTLPRPDLVTWISGADRSSDRRKVPGRLRLVLPGRTDVGEPAPSPGRRVVAVGDWGYPPNRDGLRWLVERVLPRTSAVVDVYGRGAPDLSSPSVRVHGYARDAADLLRRGDVHLGPVRFGGGVKRKVLQPLLAGLPVVTTTAGAHGLRSHPLLDVRDDPAGFAAALDARLAGSAVPAPADPADLLDADDSGAVGAWLRDCPGC